ncbi:TIGR04219 family outer membrane beta-barrel protein [Oceanimonas sp. CAM02]|uniref:TIGR04219 family outer membrane beta-barrel protein n=1 Tax=Oceanimonas sp. CAM02 TaxID=3080336 RepID=UPI002936A827|nr:TIGR04219 family outer membrane beta-barrel protein [Oceanimonas sp. CAM02]MDV2856752.1 TIGR04219 family outer membrane beta-barrel protein [Oceanimonas sp. CAM02]
MKKTVWALALTASFVSTQAGADVMGLYAGAQAWQVDTSGNFGSTNTRADFAFDENTQGVFYVAVEHPVPLLPNVKIRHNDLAANGNTMVSGQFSFGGTDYAAGSSLSTSFDVTNTDFILYYEIFDNDLFSIDLGANIKYLDGDINVRDARGNASSEKLSAPLPLGYLKAEAALPLTGLSVFGEVNYLTLDGHEIADYQAGVGYNLIDTVAVNINLHAGYRAMSVQLDDLDNIDAKLDFDGGFVGAEIHF